MRLCVPLLGRLSSSHNKFPTWNILYSMRLCPTPQMSHLGERRGGRGGDLKGHLITFRPPTFSWWQIAAPCDLVVGGKQSGRGAHFEEDSSSSPTVAISGAIGSANIGRGRPSPSLRFRN